MMIFKYTCHISSPYFPENSSLSLPTHYITGAPRVATSNGQSPEAVPRNAGFGAHCPNGWLMTS